MAVDLDQVKAIYQRYLERDAEPQALEYWGKCNSVLDVELGVWGSDEFKNNGVCFHAPNMSANWKVCVLEEARIIFVPIAKNAHTSLLDAFLKLKRIDWRKLPIHDELVLEHGDNDIKIHYALQGNNTGLLLKDYSARYVDEAFGRDDWIRVAVLRNPLDRFISAFNHLFLQERNNPFWHRHIRGIFPDWGKQNDFKNLSDEEILKLVIKRIFAHGLAAEVHFRRQCEYLSDFRIDCLIPIERLDVLQKLVMSRSGKSLEVPRMNIRGEATDQILTLKDRAILEDYYWLDKRLYMNAKTDIDETARMYIG